ncbi:hypothetical protein QLR68_34265, partial [Micromonospora sp. DH15]|nr:hypothetical protein [Micromonospora sp. DH15]
HRELPLRHVLAAADGVLMLRYAREAQANANTEAEANAEANPDAANAEANPDAAPAPAAAS